MIAYLIYEKGDEMARLATPPGEQSKSNQVVKSLEASICLPGYIILIAL